MLKAGFGRVDITPPFGTDISGYFHRRLSDGILDPLYANALAVNDGERTAVLIALDYIGVMIDAMNELRQTVSDRCGVPFEYVYVSCLHQHTAACIQAPGSHSSSFVDRVTALRDDTFVRVVFRRIADAAKMAIDDMADAEMGCAIRETDEKIAFCRRMFVEGGSVKCNPSDKYHPVRPAEQSDNNVRMLRFKREGKKDIALINFSTHPDVIGGTKYSADWPGFVRRFVEEDLDTHAIFFTGCQGDSNHYNFLIPKEQRGGGYKHSRHMGRVVADAVVKMWDDTKPCSGDIAVASEIIYTKTSTEGLERAKEFEEWYKTLDWDGHPKAPEGVSIAYAIRLAFVRTQPMFQRVPLTVLRIGGAVLFGLGGEVFSYYGQMARDLMPDKFVISTVITNGYENYLPTAEAIKQGSYEPEGTYYTTELQSDIEAAAKRVTEKIK